MSPLKGVTSFYFYTFYLFTSFFILLNCIFSYFLQKSWWRVSFWNTVWLDGRESEWAPGVGDGQRDLACCDSWGRKESDTTEWLNWTVAFLKRILCLELIDNFPGWKIPGLISDFHIFWKHFFPCHLKSSVTEISNAVYLLATSNL